MSSNPIDRIELRQVINEILDQRKAEEQGSHPELTDQDRAKAILNLIDRRHIASGDEADRANAVMKLLSIGEHEKAERTDFKTWLADFKASEREREARKAPLSTPTADDMAPAEEPPGRPPTDARHYRSWLSKVEKWFSTRPEPPRMPEIPTPAELRAEREAQAAQRRRQDAQIREIQSANERAVRARFGPSFGWLGN